MPDLICANCGASASLPLGMHCDDHRPMPVGGRGTTEPARQTQLGSPRWRCTCRQDDTGRIPEWSADCPHHGDLAGRGGTKEDTMPDLDAIARRIDSGQYLTSPWGFQGSADLAALLAECGRLRDALTFYADTANYDDWEDSEVMNDLGLRARGALGGAS